MPPGVFDNRTRTNHIHNLIQNCHLENPYVCRLAAKSWHATFYAARHRDLWIAGSRYLRVGTYICSCRREGGWCVWGRRVYLLLSCGPLGTRGWREENVHKSNGRTTRDWLIIADNAGDWQVSLNVGDNGSSRAAAVKRKGCGKLFFFK